MKKILTIIVVAGLLTCGSGYAGSARQRTAKSPATATLISLLGTAIPVGFGLASGDEGGAILFLAGATIGPGTGHLYAGNSGRFFLGFGVRTVGLGACVAAFAASWDNPDADGASEGFAAGMVLLGFSSLIDIATASKSALKYNEKHGLNKVSVAPTYFPAKKAFGLRVSLTL